jgi:alginate O-acetyltransferase complex protein AlgI
MGTASFQFLAFGIVAAIVYNLWGSVLWRQGALLIANVLFLYSFVSDVRGILPFAAFLAAGYAGVWLMEQEWGKRAFVPMLVLTVGAFVWLKKYTILPAASFLSFAYVTIGLSYILFRVLHLIVDTRYGVIAEKMGIVTYLNYVLNFMTLVSGPIQRFEDFEKQHLAKPRPAMDWDLAGEGIHRIVTGFFQVSVLSWLLLMMHKSELAALSAAQMPREKILTALGIAVSYTFYLYFNFAGYISIVIGIGRFFRWKLPENFDRPFSADSFINFWSRWHITLSTWLKTYVYNPLLMGMMRRVNSLEWEPVCSAVALFCTFFLIGVWHGRTSEFVTFGFLQGLGVAGNQVFQVTMGRWLGKKRYKALAADAVYAAFCRGLTFTWFTFSLLWFWGDWKELGRMASVLGLAGIAGAGALLFVGATVCLTAVETVRGWALSVRYNGAPVLTSRYALTVADTAQMAITVCIVLLFATHNPELVYDAF